MSDDPAAPLESNGNSGGVGTGPLIPSLILVAVLGGLGYWAYSYIFEDPLSGSAIDRSQPYVVEIDQDNPPAESNVPGGPDGGGGGGGFGGGGGRGGGGGGFDPAARFTQADADGDGLIQGDELQGRMKDNLAEIDTDGDGAISQEELTARFEAMRAQFGGGRGGRGDGDGGRGDRPELESDDDEDASEGDSDDQ